jgi:small subunit ribosomal protein S16
MVRIRLRRVGGKKQASFRVVAAEKESPRNGRFIEILGFYNPRTEPATISLKEDRIYHWISNGAQPSDSAMQVFKVAGLLDRFERFKSGEKTETLLAEAETAGKSRAASLQTQRSAPAAGTSKRKKAAKSEAEAKVEAAKPAAAPAAEPAAEAEAPKTEEVPVVEPAAEAKAPKAEEAPPAAESEAPKTEETPPAAEPETPKAEETPSA